MAKKMLISALIFCVFLVSRADAMVSFVVIETGLADEAPKKEYSMLWEDSFFDVFFDAGHIISNAPMMRLPGHQAGSFPQEAMPKLDKAKEGGAVFFIAAILDYAPAALIPDNISLQIFRLAPHEKVHGLQFNTGPQRTAMESHDNVRAIIRGVIPYLDQR